MIKLTNKPKSKWLRRYAARVNESLPICSNAGVTSGGYLRYVKGAYCTHKCEFRGDQRVEEPDKWILCSHPDFARGALS
jgi:hypothetical protein